MSTGVTKKASTDRIADEYFLWFGTIANEEYPRLHCSSGERQHDLEQRCNQALDDLRDDSQEGRFPARIVLRFSGEITGEFDQSCREFLKHLLRGSPSNAPSGLFKTIEFETGIWQDCDSTDFNGGKVNREKGVLKPITSGQLAVTPPEDLVKMARDVYSDDQLKEIHRTVLPQIDLSAVVEQVRQELLEQLCAARDSLNLTPAELANEISKRMGRSRSAVYGYFDSHANPRLDTLFALVKALDRKLEITIGDDTFVVSGRDPVEKIRKKLARIISLSGESFRAIGRRMNDSSEARVHQILQTHSSIPTLVSFLELACSVPARVRLKLK